MTAVAKLFKNGSSQAVRLPKEYRFENQDEVFVKKVENGVLLMPKNDTSVWDKWFDSLNDFTDDFMDERNQPEAQVRENLF